MIEEIIGYSGAIISSVSFVPQVYKLWKTKSGQNLSMLTLIFLATNATLWFTYGLLKDAKPLWITNSLVMMMILSMIVLKIIYRNNVPRA
ncbi:hypothetical protein CMU49_13920 [Elizabethkingia anophelis]|nr:hypothetical protein [Elizabethkingia anophelis]